MAQLKVDAAHLEQLAAAQDEAGDNLEQSAQATHGVRWKCWLSHGAISSYSNLAIWAAEYERSEAVGRIENETRRLSENLRTAAAAYQRSDDELGAGLDRAIVATDPA